MFSRSLDKSYEIAGRLVPQGKELMLGTLVSSQSLGLVLLLRECCDLKGRIAGLVRSHKNGLIPLRGQ